MGYADLVSYRFPKIAFFRLITSDWFLIQVNELDGFMFQPELFAESAQGFTERIEHIAVGSVIAVRVAVPEHKPGVPVVVIINGSPHSFFLPYTSSA